MHRDIKLSNCLLDEEGHLKLCDFGCCKVLFGIEDCVGPYSPRKSFEFCPRTKTYIGTPPFMAPEVAAFRNEKELPLEGYCLPVDWYAVGVVLFELLTGDHEPCLHYQGDLNTLLSEENMYDKDQCKKAGVDDFIRQLLAADPGLRYGYWQSDRVLSHPVFKDHHIDWSRIEQGTSESPYSHFDKSRGHFELLGVQAGNDTFLTIEQQAQFEDF